MKERLKIAATAHKFGSEFLVVGGITFSTTLLIVKLKPDPITVFDCAILLAAVFAMLIGYLKLSEPRYNLVLSKNGLLFSHRYGKFRMARKNIEKVGQVSIVQEMQQHELPCIGIRFKDLSNVINRMPPRLAYKLIVEQRNWLIAGIKIKWPAGNVPDDWLIEPHIYKGSFSTNGLLAMLTHRLEHFDTLYGYHFLISYNYFDRKPDEFSNLLQHWLRDPEKTLQKYCNIE